MKRHVLAVTLVCAISTIARADWPADAGVDVPVANVGTNLTPSVVGDGKLGVFVTFEHTGAPPSLTMRGEHFDATGSRLWSTADSDGGYIGKDLLGLSLGAQSTGKVLAITDGRGGLIAGYAPGTASFTLELQRFDSTGTPQWTATGSYGGVALLATPYENISFYMVPDQQEGALIFWLSNGAIGQRVDSTGATQYGNGFTWGNTQYPPDFYADRFLTGDGWGGMYFIASTSGSASQSPLLQHLDPSGASTFSVPSVAPNNSGAFSEWAAAGLPDGGGAWAAWWDPGSPGNLYLQLFLADGGMGFDAGPARGVLVSQTMAGDVDPTLLNDGTGGAVVAWFNSVSGVYVLEAQHYGADGTHLWGANPLLLSSAEFLPVSPSGYQPSFRLIPTTDGNVAAFWASSVPGVYGEKVDVTSGTKLWGPTSGGVKISSAPFLVWLDATFIEDDSAFVTFEDSQGRAWIKHVRADGTLGESDAGVGGTTGTTGGGTTSGTAAGTTAGGGSTTAGATTSGTAAGGSSTGGATSGGTTGGGTTGSADAGVTPSGSSGCGCTSTGPDALWFVAAVSLFAVASRRRVRRQS